ncbi:DUF4124 domain-containing protein [Haliea sp. E1-2-M8]|uniref:DUF4124 domain-containing protein n=1 Tax=Haliea sp. E1-2-M8 TaxID=3064706 RepID=UPI002725990E|nr:DUF4124 domain-containing protein [Haliea sp. E1-2-M8]MDO8862737.1 DUF4124 domain-containing protein [Haliea sp. E1-2-M8]
MLVSLFFFLACGAAADSTNVYRVVDSNGVVGFSDVPPDDLAAAEVIAIDTPQPVSAEESRQQLEAMRETTERMAADRREREAQREAARERAAREPVVAGVRQAQPEVRYEYIYLPPQVPFRPWRPGFHPPQRPQPARPPQGIIKDPNSQLMRPILSRSRD